MISKRQWLETNNSRQGKVMWKKGDWVRITKLAERPEAKVSACPDEEFIPGEQNSLSLPVEYWAEGYLVNTPVVGDFLIIDRRIRNGIRFSGVFHTSLVQEIQGNIIATINSIYRIEIKSLPDSENEKD